MVAELRERHIQTVCLFILSVVAIAFALWWLRPVMIPFVLALFFSIGLSPLITFQSRYLHFPRPLAALATLVFGCVLLVVLGSVVSVSVSQLSENTDVYQRKINQLLERLIILAESFGLEPVNTFSSLSALPIEKVSGMLTGATKAILDLLSKGSLVLVFLFFLLLGNSSRTETGGGVIGEVERRIKRYLVAKAVISAATGVLVGFVLSMLRVELALVFGLFAFLLNFVPSVGPVVATLLPLPVVLVSPNSSLTIIVLAIALPALIQLIVGSLIEPKIMGGSLDLHPITVLLALIVWGMLWGGVGMLLAVPLTAVMKIFFERMDHTAPLAELLAGRLDAFETD